MKKKELRKRYLKKRAALSQDFIDEISHIVGGLFFKIDGIKKSQYFHTYLAKKGELSTFSLVEKLLYQGKKVVVSKTKFQTKQMIHYAYDSQNLVQGTWGIPEPISGVLVPSGQLEVAIIPLLLSDKLGYRVGYGQGIYDRFLSECNPKMMKIGLSIFDPIEEIEDIEPHDIALNFLITPKKIWSF